MASLSYRRWALIVLAVIAATVDIVLMVRHSMPADVRVWTAYMPQIEKEQAEGRNLPLFTSDSWDERVPRSSVLMPPEAAQQSMFQDFLKCHADAVVYEQPQVWPQLPSRFYIYAHDDAVAACARNTLPTGYRLVSGALPKAITPPIPSN